MQRTIIRALAILGVFMYLVILGSSQVTLSKGWGPGKRSVYDDICKLTTKSVITVHHTPLSELMRLITCEMRGMSAYGKLGDRTPWYEMPSTNE